MSAPDFALAATPTNYGPFKLWHCFCDCTPDVALCGKKSPVDDVRRPYPLGPTCPACVDLDPLPCPHCADTGVRP